MNCLGFYGDCVLWVPRTPRDRLSGSPELRFPFGPFAARTRALMGVGANQPHTAVREDLTQLVRDRPDHEHIHVEDELAIAAGRHAHTLDGARDHRAVRSEPSCHIGVRTTSHDATRGTLARSRATWLSSTSTRFTSLLSSKARRLSRVSRKRSTSCCLVRRDSARRTCGLAYVESVS